MSVAVPIFGTRVAPTFLHCDTLRLARLAGGKVVSHETLRMAGLTEDERIKLLEDRRVSLLVCGGIGRELVAELESRRIDVIRNVAGEVDEVLASLARGELRSGYGISYRPGGGGSAGDDAAAGTRPAATDAGQGDAPRIDCIDCPHRRCLESGSCPEGRLVAGAATDAGLRQILETATDIAAEPERILCRISELVYFCLGMRYEHVGLAFCVDLFSEAEIVARLLSRFVPVTTVCCRVGVGTNPGPEGSDNGAEPCCNAAAMARILNEAHTDLNVLIGLGMGSDVAFAQLSHAPVTTLFVKDRLLANNPIAAVHSRYVLDQVISGM